VSSTSRSGEICWPVPAELEEGSDVVYRNSFLADLAKVPPAEAVRRYVYLTPAEMRELVESGIAQTGCGPLSGTGIELGAGCGLLSSVVAQSEAVKDIYSVELCRAAAHQLMPRVASWVLNDRANKVIPVYGSFDDLAVPDSSIDFIVEIDSLHHSYNLERSFCESARALKPGGRMLLFDRCHPDTLGDDEVEAMLNIVYGRDFLAKNHYPLDLKLTRRQNGEHEYRLREWKAGFAAAGLELRSMCQFIPRVALKSAVKGLVAFLPHPIQKSLFSGGTARFSSTKDFFSSHAATLTDGPMGPRYLAPRDYTVFFLVKPE
jgi:SAM-dependent methyltransferase